MHEKALLLLLLNSAELPNGSSSRYCSDPLCIDPVIRPKLEGVVSVMDDDGEDPFARLALIKSRPTARARRQLCQRANASRRVATDRTDR